MHINEVEDRVKFKNKRTKEKIKNLPFEKPFDFIEYVEKQKENEIDVGLFFEQAGKKTRLYTINYL